MPITVHCHCGHEFAAGDHFAGKSAPCPSCGRTAAVPRMGETAAAPPAGGSAGPLAPITVACVGCGGQYVAPPHLIGQSMPCPQCGLVIDVREAPAAELPVPIPSAPEWDDPYTPERRRQRRQDRKQKRRRIESRQDRVIRGVGGWVGLGVSAACQAAIFFLGLWHILETANQPVVQVTTTLVLAWVALLGITAAALGGGAALAVRTPEGRSFSLLSVGAVILLSLGLGMMVIPIYAAEDGLFLERSYYEQYATFILLAFFAGLTLFAPGVSDFFDG